MTIRELAEAVRLMRFAQRRPAPASAKHARARLLRLELEVDLMVADVLCLHDGEAAGPGGVGGRPPAAPFAVFARWLAWCDSPEGLAHRRKAGGEGTEYDLLALIPAPPGQAIFTVRDLRALVAAGAGGAVSSVPGEGSAMTDAERDELRQLQDHWLAHPLVQSHITRWGEGECIAAPGSPTYAEVRAALLPAWRGWFVAFLEASE